MKFPGVDRGCRFDETSNESLMKKEEITALFDQQASAYDEKWSRTAPINHALHMLAGTVLSELPPDARILCVGAGTGVEILYLAEAFPGWRFTAVEPSAGMLEVFRKRAEERGITSRCTFHCGYLESFPAAGPFEAATAFLVSQFILDRQSRSGFFQSIADRLCPEGLLLSSDLAGDLETPEGRGLLAVWFRLMNASGVSSEGIERMRQAYIRDVAVLPPGDVRKIISRGGFDAPAQFYQAGLIHAWYARRRPTKPDRSPAASIEWEDAGRDDG